MKLDKASLKRAAAWVVGVNVAAFAGLVLMGHMGKGNRSWECRSTGIGIDKVGVVELLEPPQGWLTTCRTAHARGDTPSVLTRSGYSLHADDGGEVQFDEHNVVDWELNAALIVERTRTKYEVMLEFVDHVPFALADQGSWQPGGAGKRLRTGLIDMG